MKDSIISDKKLLSENEYFISKQLLRCGTTIRANIEEIIKILTEIVKTSQKNLTKH